jgi:hypothetical protein
LVIFSTYEFAVSAWGKIQALLEAVITVCVVFFHLVIMDALLVLLFNKIAQDRIFKQQNVTCRHENNKNYERVTLLRQIQIEEFLNFKK